MLLHSFPREGGLGQEAHVVGRHPHEHRRFGQQLQGPLGLEFWFEEHRAAVHQEAVSGDEQAVHVEDRQHVQQHVSGPESPVAMEHLGIGGEVPVGQHGSLGTAGGAGSVKDGREVVAAAEDGGEGVGVHRRRCGQAAATLVVEVEHVGYAGLDGQFLGQGADLRPADEHPGCGVTEEVLDFTALIGVVQRQVNGTGAQTAEIEKERLR